MDYDYKPKDRYFRAIESAVPGVESTKVLPEGALRVTYRVDLDTYSRDALDGIMADLGFVPVV